MNKWTNNENHNMTSRLNVKHVKQRQKLLTAGTIDCHAIKGNIFRIIITYINKCTALIVYYMKYTAV